MKLPPNTTPAQRRKRAVLVTVLFLFLGIAYAVFVHFTHLSIPCLFRLVTGLRCPGCGMTSAMMALLHGDPLRGLRYNYFFVPIWSILAVIYLHTVFDYIRTGRHSLTTGNEILNWAFFGSLLVWGVVRNIVGV